MGSTVRWLRDWLCKPVLITFLCVLSSSQATYGQAKDETTQQTNEKIQELGSLGKSTLADIPIGAGDLLHIDVFDVPELSRDVRVSTTGGISFPLIHEKIKAAGATTFQLEQKIQDLLRQNGLVSDPQVTVFIKEQNSQPVTIIGAVVHPMTYQLNRPMSLLELIATAGGITDGAGTVILITRRTETETLAPISDTSNSSAPAAGDLEPGAKTIRIRLQDLLDTENTAFNIPIYGGDVINIPIGGIVYVMGGGVSQQGGYVVQSHGEQITVLKAVALAHGLGGYAKPDDAVIYRMNPNKGEREAIPVHIKQIAQNKSQDVAMKSNDILYVPDSLTRKILVRGAEAAVTIATGVLIYRSANP
jgi:polysaccharide export outer membrane protein